MGIITRTVKTKINQAAHDLSLRFYEKAVKDLSAQVANDQQGTEPQDLIRDRADEIMDEFRI